MVKKKASKKKVVAKKKVAKTVTKKAPIRKRKVAAKKKAPAKQAQVAREVANFDFFERPDPTNPRGKHIGFTITGKHFPTGFHGMEVVVQGKGVPRDRRRMQKTLSRLLAGEFRKA